MNGYKWGRPTFACFQNIEHSLILIIPCILSTFSYMHTHFEVASLVSVSVFVTPGIVSRLLTPIPDAVYIT